MGYTTPITAVTGIVATAADWNASVRDNVIAVANPPKARARAVAAQSLASGGGAFTTVTLDVEDYDTDSMHSTVSNTGRLTANTARTYTILGGVYFNSVAVSAVCGVQLVKNGTLILAEHFGVTTASGSSLPIGTEVAMSAADYVELKALQVTGGAVNINDASHQRTFLTAIGSSL